jgi:hypothetical protein
MAKLTLSDLANLTNQTSAVATLNANWALIEAFAETVLSRDGTTPNTMTADLDMNSNDILNVGSITFSDGTDVTDALLTTPDPSVDNSIVRWDGITGTAIDDTTGWLISDADLMTAGSHLNMSGSNITSILNLTMTGSGTLDTAGAALTTGAGLVDTEGGNLNLGGGYIIEYSEKADAESSSSNAITLDLDNGNMFYTTLSENITTVTFSNLPASGQFASWSWEITQDSSARTITWPAAVEWSGGTAITLSTGSGAKDVVNFWTRDGGTTIGATVVGQDFS